MGYQITGTRDRVLDVRALNGTRQPLASSSSFASDFLFGRRPLRARYYSGVVDRLGITFAIEEKGVELPFVLTDFSFAGRPGGGPLDKTPPFRPYSHEALRRDSSRKPLLVRSMPEPPRAVTVLEGFELSLDKVQPFYALRLDFTLRSPEVPNFQSAFTVGELRLTRLGLRDGTVILPPAAVGATAAAAVGSNWDRAVHFGSAPKDGVLSTSVSFYIDTDARPEDLKSVQGSLTMHFPRAFETLALESLTVGRQAQRRDLTATVVARGRKSLTIETNKEGDRVYYIRLLGGMTSLCLHRPEHHRRAGQRVALRALAAWPPGTGRSDFRRGPGAPSLPDSPHAQVERSATLAPFGNGRPLWPRSPEISPDPDAAVPGARSCTDASSAQWQVASRRLTIFGGPPTAVNPRRASHARETRICCQTMILGYGITA